MGESAQDVIDEMICAATLETFRAEAPLLELERTQRGSLLARSELTAHVRFSGSGGAGVLALGCGVDGMPAAASAPEHAEHASHTTWVTERVQALGHRIEKRLRQFGVVVRLEAPETAWQAGPLVPAQAQGRSYRFRAGGKELCVHFDAELDVERITSAGEVPLRDEGDIILF